MPVTGILARQECCFLIYLDVIQIMAATGLARYKYTVQVLTNRAIDEAKNVIA